MDGSVAKPDFSRDLAAMLIVVELGRDCRSSAFLRDARTGLWSLAES